MLVAQIPSRCLVVAAVAAAMCGVVGGAAAAPVAVIGVATRDPPVSAAAMAAAVVRGLAAGGGDAIGDGVERAAAAVAAGAVRAQRLEAFRRVQETAAEGWRRYLEVAPDVAAVRLGQARLDAEALLGLDGGRELYADISLRLGVVLHTLGRGDDAARVFRLARALDPERAVGMADFAPDAVAAFERAVAAPEAARRGVQLAVRPVGAAIEVDGVAIGEATAAGREVELAPGQHVVAARAAGYESRGLGFAVDGGGRSGGGERVELGLDRDGEAALLVEGRSGDRAGRILGPGTSAADAARAVAAVLRYGELDALILVAAVWQRGAPTLLGQRCSATADGDIGCSPVLELAVARPEELETAAAELARRLGAAGPAAGPVSLPSDPRLSGGEPRPGTRTTGRCRLCHNRWLWLGAAAATIVVGGGTIWALTRDPSTETLIGIDPTDW